MCFQEYLQVIIDQLNKIETFLQLTSMLHFLLHEDWTWHSDGWKYTRNACPPCDHLLDERQGMGYPRQ